MLRLLHIENIAVIEQADILFERGFNVMTGETGAGKSIVIDAISAILGERAYRDMIRTGAARAAVRAIFDDVPELAWFAENSVPYDTEVVVQREIYLDGKNLCRVNGVAVTVGILRRLGLQLINIHGQHDSAALFDENYHLTFLDSFAADAPLLEQYRAQFSVMQSLQREMSHLRMDESEKLRRTETLRYQIDEIERAALKPDEDTQLETRRRLLQNTYYEAAMCLREPPAWGSLSGVRPTKLTTRALLEGRTPAEAEKLLRTRYHVSPERSRLCVEASEATVQAAQLLRPQDVSVYVGIPFCPTRCAYCSFVSSSIERFSGLLEPYLDALIREIAHTGDLLRASGRTVRTLYIGGGTPTTLSAAQLRRLMEALRTHIDLTELVEYTVEGGRPDTLDAEKLETIASMGCGRMSINPQTMNDAVLARVGRRHTAAQTVAAYEAARAAGYDAVNMDLIAGLPGDDPKSFADSLRQVLALAPENVTVHTLALKKGADLYAGRMELPSADDVAQMLAGAEASLRAAGYTPYYLYRQKYMSGSFENIGWCRPGTAGLYNIYMMEEMHSIVSLGGGAMTKINLPDGRLERFHNPKFPQQYLERIDDVLAQKDAAFRLL